MTLGADHSTAGAIIGGTLKRDGLGGGIGRYACEGRGSVNLTRGEVADLKANGIPIWVVCEHEEKWLLATDSVAGRVQGSRAITRAVGLPDGVLYLAADFDITEGGPTSPGSPGDRNMRQCLASLERAAAVIGREYVGFYGSKFATDWLAREAPWIRWYWGTEAWSHRERHPAWSLFQRAQSASVAGVRCDVNEILRPQFGARVAPHPAPKPEPKPKPGPAGGHSKARAQLVVDIEGDLTHNPDGVHWQVRGSRIVGEPWGD